jgi:hypothetical protein
MFDYTSYVALLELATLLKDPSNINISVFIIA